MFAEVGSAFVLCNKSLTLEEFAHVEIIALFVVARQWRVPCKHTPCDIKGQLLKSTTMLVVSEYKLFKENQLCHF